MKKNAPPTTPAPAAKARMSALEDRINAGWLRLWKTVWPNTPPPGQILSPMSNVQSPADEGRPSRFRVRGPKSKARRSSARQPAAPDYLSRFLSIGYALALLASGCASRPLKGGKAVITRKPTGQFEQTLMQGENPAQATKQSQETVKVRTYTVPAGSRIDQSQMPASMAVQPASPASSSRQPSTLNSQPLALNPQPASSSPLPCP